MKKDKTESLKNEDDLFEGPIVKGETKGPLLRRSERRKKQESEQTSPDASASSQNSLQPEPEASDIKETEDQAKPSSVSADQAPETEPAKDKSASEEDAFEPVEESRQTEVKKPRKSRSRYMTPYTIIGVLICVLLILLGVLFYHYSQIKGRVSEVYASESALYDDYTAMVQNAALPEGWDPAVLDALKQQAMSAYDTSVLDRARQAMEGDKEASAQIEESPSQSEQGQADKYRQLFASLPALPASVADILAKDSGLLDFVLGYFNNPDTAGQDAALDVSLDTVPDLKASDVRWGYVPYSNGIMASNGSIPTALSEVFAHILQDPSLTPLSMARFMQENGFENTWQDEAGSTVFAWAALTYGVDMFPLNPYPSIISKQLDLGDKIILIMNDDRALVGVGRDENGNWILHDPSSSREEYRMDPAAIKDSITAAWAFW